MVQGSRGQHLVRAAKREEVKNQVGAFEGNLAFRRLCAKTRELSQTILLNAEDAEAFAKERKGKPFSAPSAKAFASSALKTILTIRNL